MFGHRCDEARIGRNFPQRAAQRPNALRQRFVRNRNLVPDLIHKQVLGDKLAATRDQQGERVEIAAPKRDRQAVLAQLPVVAIELKSGGATAESLLEPMFETGVPMFNVYGQTETCGTVTATNAGASPKIMAEKFGRSLPRAEMRIADANVTPLPHGTAGEIEVRGPYCMTGYFGRPEATAEAFTAGGYLRTGDLGVEHTDGNFSFAGRLKQMCEHPRIGLAAVLLIPHPIF